MNSLDRMLLRLTDAYSKETNSNVGKLLALAAEQIDDLRGSVEKTGTWRDIDEAEGETLDRIGYNVQQWRGQANDDIYRILIKSKVARNRSDGSVNTIIEVLAITLDVEYDQIQVRELWDDTVDPEPAAIFVDVPAEPLNEIGFSITQFGRLVNRIVAAGVRASVLFQGTFQFSSSIDSSEMDTDTGFADLAQTQGGQLGEIYDPEDDPDLPI